MLWVCHCHTGSVLLSLPNPQPGEPQNVPKMSVVLEETQSSAPVGGGRAIQTRCAGRGVLAGCVPH